MESPRPTLPQPLSAVSRNSTIFFGEADPPPTPRSPLPRSPSYMDKSKNVEMKRKNSKRIEREAIDELDLEAERVRAGVDVGKSTFEDFHPEDYQLEEGESRRYLDPRAEQDHLLQELLKTLQEWVNDMLDDEDRIRVTNMTEDFYDGVVFKKIVEKLAGITIKMPLEEDVQAKERQKKNLNAVLDQIAAILHLAPDLAQWSVESVFERNLLSNVQILLALIEYFGPSGKISVQLPKSFKSTIVLVGKRNGRMEYSLKPITLISNQSKKDGFDSLIDHSPEKINFVKRNLLKFCNTALGKLDILIEDLNTDFANGVNLILLIGLVEGFYVPLYEYFQTPNTYEEKLHNAKLAFDFLDEMNVPRRNQPSQIVRGDLKATMRIIYCLFVKVNDNKPE